ncbi:MAG: hypothetical protein ACXIUB_10750 [Wenzhouxiangella sp.]
MRVIPVTVACLCLLLLPMLALADSPGADEEKAALRAQIDQMQRQLVRMQQQLDQLESERVPALEEAADDERVVELESRLAAIEDADDGDGINVGGAVRLNYGWQDYSPQNKDRLGDFELELFRINFSGSIGNVLLDAEWRRYNDFQAIHHAWIGYDFSDELQMQLGISRVPFGILPYTSHSFWFTGAYYMGYEDDYDTGIQFIHRPSDDWTLHYAFFKNPEYANDSRADRYSFDLVTEGDQANTETNQFNFRLERHLTLAGDSRMDLGMSLQAGQIYNRITERNGQRWAAAAHMDYYNGPWNLRLQAMRYEYDPENPEGVSTDFVQKAGFGFPFLMASEANVYSYSVSRAFDVDWGPISNVRCYNEGTWLDPQVSNSSESIQSVTGCSVAAGGVFTYFDWIAGKNMWFAGGDGIGLDGDSAGRWRSRLNINIGYYF